jgi:phage-related protein (TIGR01555 family)
MSNKGWFSGLADRFDGWSNVLTGIGLASRDKRMGATFQSESLTRAQLEDIWRGDDMAARIIETIPDEMTRQGYCVNIPDSKEHAEALVTQATKLQVNSAIKTALNYERAYGGGGILLGANDGQSLHLPLNYEHVRSLDWLTPLASNELMPVRYYTDPRAPKFGQVELYRLQPETGFGSQHVSLVEVHESRVIRFNGITVSKRQMQVNGGWGDSVLVRCHRVLSDFHQSWGSAAILLQDFSQGILKIKELSDLISTNADDVVIKRAQILDMQRSVARMLILDSEEDFERKMTPMTGMPEMLEKFSLRLAASAEMPVSLLMGQAPAGMNATGASDIRFFYDRCKSRQTTSLLQPLQMIFELMMSAKDGPTRGQVPKKWSITFNPLWQLTDLEQADLRYKTSQADEIDVRNHILTPEECTNSHYTGESYSPRIVVDLKSRGEFFSEGEPAGQDFGEDDE